MPDTRDHATTEQLADLLADVLPADQEADLEAHLATCERCRAEHDELAHLPAILASAPVPPMPAEVAARLDDTLAAESKRRAVRGAGASVSRLQSARLAWADRARPWFVGVAAAAAAVVAVSVVGDVWVQGGDSQDSSSTAGGAGGSTADRSAPENAPENALPGRALKQLPAVDSASFAADVRDLYDVRSGTFSSDAAAIPDKDARGTSAQAESLLGRRVARDCTARSLRAAGVDGTLGPLVRLDGDRVARLVAVDTSPGRTGENTVVAYSCTNGKRLAAAPVGGRR